MSQRQKVDAVQVREMLVEVWDVTKYMQWRRTGYELIDSKTRSILGYVYTKKVGFSISSRSNSFYTTLAEAVAAQAIISAHSHGWEGML